MTNPAENRAPEQCRRSLARLAALIRRAERNEGTGRNAAATTRAAYANLDAATRALVRAEDHYGIGAMGAMSDTTTALRRRAIAQGLITPDDVLSIEAAAAAQPAAGGRGRRP